MRKLGGARRRLVFEQFLRYGIWALMAGLGAVAVWQAISFPRRVPTLPAAGFACSPLLVAALAAWWRWRSLKAVARETDCRLPTRDRFTTFVGLDGKGGRLVEAMRREVAGFAKSAACMFPIQWPWKLLGVLLIPLIVLGMQLSYRAFWIARRAPEVAEGRALIEKARQLALDEKQADLAPIVRQLEEQAEKLEHQDEPLREAMRAIASLERQLAAAAAGGMNPQDAEALAAAVSDRNPALAKLLREGRYREAAAAVAGLDAEAVREAIERAARHREESRFRQMLMSGAPGIREELIAQLRSADRPSGRLSAALRDLKSGGDAAGQMGLLAQEGRAGGETPAALADEAPPGGAPGSERDLTRGSDISGEKEPLAAQSGSDDVVPGSPGEGPSLVQLFRAAGGDDARAQRTYRSIYDSAAPAALSAVNREEIPPGSRLLVRRYFESIRPRE